MGPVLKEMLRLEAERQARDQTLRVRDNEIIAAQIQAIQSVVNALVEDRADLQRLGILLVNPETGAELDDRNPNIRGVTIVDATGENRFDDLTIEFHYDTKSFSLVEWRGREDPEPGTNPFERQRVNFDEHSTCLTWLANFLFQHVDLDTGTHSRPSGEWMRATSTEGDT